MSNNQAEATLENEEEDEYYYIEQVVEPTTTTASAAQSIPTAAEEQHEEEIVVDTRGTEEQVVDTEGEEEVVVDTEEEGEEEYDVEEVSQSQHSVETDEEETPILPEQEQQALPSVPSSSSSSSPSEGSSGQEEERQRLEKERRKKKKKKRKKRRKRKREQPSGYHGREIDMVAIKEQYKPRSSSRIVSSAPKSIDFAGNLQQDNVDNLSTRSPRSKFDYSLRLPEEKRNMFLHDDPSEMTQGRRLALRWMNSTWYNPLANIDDDDDYSAYETKRGRRGRRYREGDSSDDDDDSSFSISERSTANDDRTAEFNKYEKPSLAKAWAYFEHVSLQRHFVYDSDEDGRPTPPKLDQAEPGATARKTRLYNPLRTPHSQLGAFGQGVALYFTTIRFIVFLTFLAGAVSVYSMWFFASDEYVTDGSGSDLPWLQQGSAICTDTSWVPCPTCDCSPENNMEKFESQKEWESSRCVRIPRENITNITTMTMEDEDDTADFLTFALKNNCDGAVWPAAIGNYIALWVIFLGIIYMGVHVTAAQVKFDEAEQTCQDYSISIKNPPPDAGDADEWREFFEKQCDGAQVAVCTTALDNDLFVQALVRRRETYRKIRHSLPPGHPMDILSIAHMAAEMEQKRGVCDWVMASLFTPGIPEYYSQLVVMNAKIQALAQLDYRVTRVFITFETEHHQRHVLEKLSVGSSGDAKLLSAPKYMFRGKHVLDVAEAQEPSTIHWQSLNVGFLRKLRQRVWSTIITGVSIYVVTLAIRKIRVFSSKGTAITISAFNVVFPYVARAIVSLEQHSNEGSLQKSLYFKIAAFRWINTVVVISLITPFTSYLDADHGLISQIYWVFFSEIVTLSAIQLLDIIGHFKRHVLAPRAKNQDSMNLYFEGEEVDIAERYTNMTKMVFMAMWYSAVYPASFFLCSLAMLINYYLDRFSFMRTWKRAPRLSAEISIFSRKYFIGVANIVMVVLSSFYWSAFPYDNLCDTGEVVDTTDPAYAGDFTITVPRRVEGIREFFGTTAAERKRLVVDIAIGSDQPVYTYCRQDFLSPGFGFTFPFLPSQQEGRGGEWMTPTQEDIAIIFGWSAVAVACAVGLRMLHGIFKDIRAGFYGDYVPIGKAQDTRFSDVAHISSYVPEVRSSLFSYPLLVCDSDTINHNYIEWEDPGRTYAFYDLTKDADALLEGSDYSKAQCFSRVKHWDNKKS